MYIYIYIYIHICRERERDVTHIYIYIYIYTLIHIHIYIQPGRVAHCVLPLTITVRVTNIGMTDDDWHCYEYLYYDSYH